MFDAGSRSEAASVPRADGAVRVGVVSRKGRTRLADLAQRGSAKCMLPRVPGRVEGVLLNTAGGVTGGDRFAWRAEAGEGATLTLATQTAERLYRAEPGSTGRIDTTFTLAPGARIDWLAQETILFDGCAVARRLEADMAGDACLRIVEPLVLGRAAMGETVRSAAFTDHWRIRRDGRLVFAEATRLVGPVAEICARAACWGPNRAAATVLEVSPRAEARLAAARAALDGVEGGASAWDGLLVCRLLAPTGQALRTALARLIAALRPEPLPRVWTM